MPEGYQPSEQIGEGLATLKAVLVQARNLQKIIDAAGLQPEPPAELEVDVEPLERHETKRLATKADIDLAMRQLATMSEARYTAEELTFAELHLAYQQDLKQRGPKPVLMVSEIQEWETYFEDCAVAQRLGDVEVICPSCNKAFCPGSAPSTPPAGVAPTAASLRQDRAAHDRWAAPALVEVPTYKVVLELTAPEIAKGWAALDQQDLRASLLATTWLPLGEDRSALLDEAKQVRLHWIIYHRDLVAWTARAAASEAAHVELAALPPVTDADVANFDSAYVAARIYESQLLTYTSATKAFSEAQNDIEDRVRRSDDYKLGAKRLAETRQKFKSHLSPTLSRIASSVINDMTGGVLSSVIVDGDMNITVNGQDIATLSGAGSTVANLAVRLALGQVLVKGVLPIFLADEADSDMEEARAQYTMECLANLKDKLHQIIVITHKSVKFTDQVITLQSNDFVED